MWKEKSTVRIKITTGKKKKEYFEKTVLGVIADETKTRMNLEIKYLTYF